ncbi:putative glucan 1,3-beta-glucosidase [Helianthus debilis subsp. tardiflorus]
MSGKPSLGLFGFVFLELIIKLYRRFLSKKASKILVAGSHADNLSYQCGGWTLQWQGVSGNNLTAGITILSAIKAAVDPRTQVVYNENPDDKYMKSNKFDYAIVVVGEYPYAEFLGDSSNLTIPEPGPTTINRSNHTPLMIES